MFFWLSDCIEQPAFHHQVDPEGFVPDFVEKDYHLVVLVALDEAFTPLLVDDTAVDGERFAAFVFLYRNAGFAVIAVPAGGLEFLTKVIEQILAAAVSHLGVAPYHLDPRPLELLAVLLGVSRLFGGAAEVVVSLAPDNLARRDNLDHARLFEASERRR